MLFIVIIIFLPLVIAGFKKLFKKTGITDKYMFDDFICNDLFVAEKYEVLPLNNPPEELLSDDSPEPDFKFSQLGTNFDFFVVTKFFPNSNTGLPEWCTKKRFDFLKAFIKKETNLFIVIGLGGTSYLPNELYLVAI